ncbi:Hypothetical predicted protein, partial [Pelobates cultripes]
YVKRLGGVVIRHRELEDMLPGYYRRDGVHLSEVGLDFLLFKLNAGHKKALAALWNSI